MNPGLQLEAALRSGRVAHCYLLCGPAYLTGELARKVATAYLCLRADRPDPGLGCGGCPSCRLAQEGVHPDLRCWEAERGVWRIEQVRLLTAEAHHRPSLGDRRVHILRDVHLLSGPSANALLKLLEEPPPGSLFLLLAADASGLPPTLLSRCQVLSWREGGELPPPGEGSAEAVLEAASRGKGPALLLLARRLADEDGAAVCASLERRLRDLAVELTLAGRWPAARGLVRAWEAVERAAGRLEAHANARLVWEALLLELAGPLRQALAGCARPGGDL